MVAVLDKQTDKEAKRQAFFDKYQPDPIGFQVDCLDVNPLHVWPKMREMAESVRDHQKTLVHAGHNVSKTFELGRLGLGFLLTHKPSTVISTAPTFDQVEKQLWKEIHTAHTNAKVPLGGKLTATQLNIDPNRKWFAYGFATKPDTVTGEATRMQGYHNEWVLLIFDEAAGILPQIWKATESLLANPRCKVIACGNPTSAHGTFADSENDPTWNFIRISVKDTPNYKEGREVIPGVAGREYEESVRLKYGEDSNEYAIRVEGRKPQWSEGTYLGSQLAQAEKDNRVGDINHDLAMPVYTFSDTGDMYAAFLFVQFVGSQINIVDFFYDSKGIGVPGWAAEKQKRKYKYAGDYTLPDIFPKGSNQKAGISGQYSIDVAHNLGMDFIKIELPNKDDQIRAAQDLVVHCHWSVEAKECFDGLLDWRKRKNEALSTPDKPMYFDEPLKTWGRHVGDAFCGLAVAYRYMSIGGSIRGRLTPTLPNLGKQTTQNAYGGDDILHRGLKMPKGVSCGRGVR
jgi:hypothetical protein